MATYRVKIDTSSYKNMRCSKANWEPGTINDHVHALHGYETVEHGEDELSWRLSMLTDTCIGWDVHDTPRYQSWLGQKKNRFTYHDKLCEMDREGEVTLPGFKQGYVNIPALVEEVKKTGRIVIPFSKAYDARQYKKNFDGCVIIVEDISRFPGDRHPLPVLIPEAMRAKLPKVNFQQMSEGQRNEKGNYIPDWNALITGASCQEEIDYIKEVRARVDNGRFEGFAYNLVYVTRMACGHWEIFQSPCNNFYHIDDVLNQGLEHAKSSKCTHCICNFK